MLLASAAFVDATDEKVLPVSRDAWSLNFFTRPMASALSVRPRGRMALVTIFLPPLGAAAATATDDRSTLKAGAMLFG